MKALVVGYGSIGKRHARILGELGCEVALVSRRHLAECQLFATIEEALDCFAPQYVVVANETSCHYQAVSALAAAGFSGDVLVEKPLFHRLTEPPDNRFQGRFVAYNLRFHPLLQKLQEILEKETVLSVQAYVGQYLPSWRPERDYRQGYSADREAGGGVLRDLSHELDFLNWILGGWQRLTALGGHLSPLEITSDDVFALLMETRCCPVVTLQMNYLDRGTQRKLTINTAQKTINVDLVAGVLEVDGIREEIKAERDLTYREMHRGVLRGVSGNLCTFAEGMDVLDMIAAAEEAMHSGKWVWKE